VGADAHRDGGQVAANIDQWGIPLLAKYHFSGAPQRTFFAKTGIMPISVTTLNNEIDWMGVFGLGATIPVSQNTSVALDGSYNRILNMGSSLSNDYQGLSLLAGLSINL